jgi:hypothetical protein
MPYDPNFNFSSTFQAGPAGEDSADIRQSILDAGKRFQDIDDAQQLELQRVATNAALGEAGQLGWDLDQIQEKAPDLYAKWANDPNVNMGVLTDSMRLRGTTANTLLDSVSGRAVDTSSIAKDTSDIATNADELLTNVDTRKTNDLDRKYNEYRLKRAGKLAEREDAEYAQQQVYEQRSAGFNEWYSADDGGFNQAALNEVLPAIARMGYTGEERERKLAKAVEDWKGDKMQDPDWIVNHAREMGLPDEAFAEINQVGRELKEIRLMAAERAIVNSEKRLKGESQQDDFKRDFAFNSNSATLGWDPVTKKYTHGAQSSNMNDGRGLRYAEKEGMQVKDETTKLALNFLKDQFSSESAYKHVLDRIRGPERKTTLTRNDMQLIADERNNLMADVAAEMNDKDTADNPGGTWLENLEFNNAAEQSQKFVPVVVPGAINSKSNITTEDLIKRLKEVDMTLNINPDRQDSPEDSASTDRSLILIKTLLDEIELIAKDQDIDSLAAWPKREVERNQKDIQSIIRDLGRGDAYYAPITTPSPGKL